MLDTQTKRRYGIYSRHGAVDLFEMSCSTIPIAKVGSSHKSHDAPREGGQSKPQKALTPLLYTGNNT